MKIEDDVIARLRLLPEDRQAEVLRFIERVEVESRDTSRTQRESCRLKASMLWALLREASPENRYETMVVGDVAGDPNWTIALAGVDCVIHCAARAHVLRESADNPLEAFRAVNLRAAPEIGEAGGFARGSPPDLLEFDRSARRKYQWTAFIFGTRHTGSSGKLRCFQMGG